MSDNIVLNVHMTAVPGKEEILAAELVKLVAPTRAEPGCVTYELYRDRENPGKFMFHEAFKGQAELDAHIAMPHFQKFVAFRAGQTPDPVAEVVVTKLKLYA